MTSMATTRVKLSTTPRSFRPAAQPIDTWSSCMADVGMLSTLAGDGQPAAVGHEGGGGVLRQHQAGVDARDRPPGRPGSP